MSTDVESTTRSTFAKVAGGLDATELDLNADMVADYGLTSMNKVLFMMSLCETLGVDLATFTEVDLAGMHTLNQVLAAMAERRPGTERVPS